MHISAVFRYFINTSAIDIDIYRNICWLDLSPPPPPPPALYMCAMCAFVYVVYIYLKGQGCSITGFNFRIAVDHVHKVNTLHRCGYRLRHLFILCMQFLESFLCEPGFQAHFNWAYLGSMCQDVYHCHHCTVYQLFLRRFLSN